MFLPIFILVALVMAMMIVSFIVLARLTNGITWILGAFIWATFWITAFICYGSSIRKFLHQG